MKPGWRPDPTGRYELRFHNGSAWTGDVAHQGQRTVDPIGAAPSNALRPTPSPRNGLAAASTALGIVGVALAWLPFLFALGLAAAVLAVVFGAIGLRRARRVEVGRALAITGLITGTVAIALGSVGVLLTILTVRAMRAYDNPEPHTVTVTSCTIDDGVAVVAGTLRNDGDEIGDFGVLVEFTRRSTDNVAGKVRISVDDVPPGDVVPFDGRRRVDLEEIECSVDEVTGPLPFGVDPGG